MYKRLEKGRSSSLQRESSLRICSKRSSWQRSCARYAGQKSGRSGKEDSTSANWLHILCGWRSPHGAGRWSLKRAGANSIRADCECQWNVVKRGSGQPQTVTFTIPAKPPKPNITPGLRWHRQQRITKRPEGLSLKTFTWLHWTLRKWRAETLVLILPCANKRAPDHRCPHRWRMPVGRRTCFF